MKLLCINGSTQDLDYGLNKIVKIVNETILEIGEVVDIINLNEFNLNYFNSVPPSLNIKSICDDLIKADGVVFVSPVHLYSTTGIMHTFLEYLSYPVYKNILENKNCMIITVSSGVGQRDCQDYFSKVINYLGGNDSIKIPLSLEVVKNIFTDEANKTSLEKYTEDFYRICKQNRKYYLPSETKYDLKSSNIPLLDGSKVKNDEVSKVIEEVIKKPTVSKIEPIKFKSLKNVGENIFIKKETLRDKDMEEITNLITSKYTKKSVFNEELVEDSKEVKPSVLSCQQLIQNLPHYFESHLEPNLKCVFQFNITGEEEFNCCIVINEGFCSFEKGVKESADVTIMAKVKDFMQVLENKLTAQRAFMTGQIKVRGNFTMLSKFDQLFKK